MDQIVVTPSGTSVIAGRTMYASAFFYDSGNPDTPTSIDYRVDYLAPDLTVTQLRDWTAAAAGDVSSSVILEDEDTAMYVSSHLKEYHVVTFRATKSGVTLDDSGLYLVTNLGYQSVVISLGCELSPMLERYSPLPSSRISRVVDLDNWNP